VIGKLVILKPLAWASRSVLAPTGASWVFALLSVESIDPISGGAGWVGTGLLGLVLAWLLLVHLPQKDRQIKEPIESKDARINTLLEQKWAALQAMSTDHKDTIEAMAGEFRSAAEGAHDHCERGIERLASLLGLPRLGNARGEQTPPAT
jgi:hypothetical protein